MHKFKATWRPFAHQETGEAIFAIGNMGRKVDIYGQKDGSQFASLSDPEKLTAIPAINAFHPNPACNMIASGNASGRISIWM